MNTREMDKLTEHFDMYFEQKDSTVLHSLIAEPHIDALLYPPSGKYPFWKLATMGASDCKMNTPKGFIGDRNEYMMFIHPDEDMTDHETVSKYYNSLMEIAVYPISSGQFISYGHSIEWRPEEGEEMVGAFLELPQMIDNVGILKCKLGLAKTAICLQAILLTRSEMDELIKVGPEQFSNYLYPEDGSACHFISELHRSDKF